MGEDPSDPEKNRADLVNAEDGDTTMEIWNLVFMQFDRIGEGEQNSEGKFDSYKLNDLPAPSVDTGMGLERIAAVLQDVLTNYDTDLMSPIIKDCIAPLADKHYEPETQEGFTMRVIADHARSTAFSIADGILPGNENRNYVLRKIMRRAIYHGREHLGFEGLFFHKVCDFVIEKMKDAFPELEVQREFIGKMVRLEEERFGNTLTVGLKKLDELFSSVEDAERFKVIMQITDHNETAQIRGNMGDIPEMLKSNPFYQKHLQSDEMKETLDKFGGAEGFQESMEMLYGDEEILKGASDLLESSATGFFTQLAKLYDTFGTPRDLIRVKLEEDFIKTEDNSRISISEELFNRFF